MKKSNESGCLYALIMKALGYLEGVVVNNHLELTSAMEIFDHFGDIISPGVNMTGQNP